jgi:hypothetical protein
MKLINGNSGISGSQLSNSGAAIFKESDSPWQAVNLHVTNPNISWTEFSST